MLGLVFAGCMQNNVHPKEVWEKVVIGSGLVVGAAVVVGAGVVASSYLFPCEFPEPSGKFGVGTEIHHFDNVKRLGSCEQDAVNLRDVTLQFWYPTEHKAAEASYPWAQEYVTEIKKRTKLVYFLGVDAVYTYAQSDVPLSNVKESYPVILYSHGMLAGLGDNASLCEDLASRGYIVVGIGHSQDEIREKNKPELSYEELIDAVTEETEIRVLEAQRVLDYLEKLSIDLENKFFGKLDLQNIGMAGHSLGGATAIQLCRNDSRCKAAVNLDGPLFGKNATEVVNKPVMFLLAEMPEISEEDQIALFQTKENYQNMVQRYVPAIDKVMSSSGKDAYKILINGSNHVAFCDFALIISYSPITRLIAEYAGWMNGYHCMDLYVGRIDAYRCHEIMKSYASAFFDKYLKHEDSALLTERK